MHALTYFFIIASIVIIIIFINYNESDNVLHKIIYGLK